MKGEHVIRFVLFHDDFIAQNTRIENDFDPSTRRGRRLPRGQK